MGFGNVLIFGDSYSTYRGCIPEGFAHYYGREDTEICGVKNADMTWWQMLLVGETLEQRELGYTETLLKFQTKMALTNVTAEQMKNVIIAYEPVWAIGTGVTATADQADEGNGYVRAAVAEMFGAEIAEATVVQYGGSMNEKNAAELLSKPNVDGGLIGGASLVSAKFAAIVDAAQ